MGLLKDAAEWDHAYSSRQRPQIELPSPNASPTNVERELNRDQLERFVRRHHPGGNRLNVTELAEIPGGMGKHTYQFKLQTNPDTTEEMILRKEDPRPVFKFGAFSIANEYHILKTVAETGYAAPTPILLAQNEPEFDSDFFVMKKSPGTLLGTFFGPIGEISEAILLDLAARMAELHSIKLSIFADYIDQFSSRAILTDTQTAYRFQLAHWEHFLVEEDLTPSPFATYVIQWLKDNVPANTNPPVLIHGDFNIHNVLAEKDRITSVLDWESALFGDPAQDLAYVKPNIERYIDWRKFMRQYYASGGRPIDESSFGYYIAFANFRPLLGSLKYMHRLNVGDTDDPRAMYIDNEFLPQFMHNILHAMRDVH